MKYKILFIKHKHYFFIIAFNIQMEQLKEKFKKLLKQEKITRQDIIPIKHHADKCNPQVSNRLAHILEDTHCEINEDKVKKLNKLYKDLLK